MTGPVSTGEGQESADDGRAVGELGDQIGFGVLGVGYLPCTDGFLPSSLSNVSSPGPLAANQTR
jgi:hypothetical protein